MRSSVAARLSKAVSLLCAALLCCSLIPTAAFAADDSSLSLIPEGGQGAVPIVSGAEGGIPDAVSHYASDEPSSVDGDGAASTSEDVTDIDEGAEAPSFINQDVELTTVVAQAESTKSFFLAQTLESTHTVPVVSASLPLDKTAALADGGTETEGEDSDDNGMPGIIAADSTVVGSFEYLGMTFAIEEGGESVALMAVDYSKLPEAFVQKQVIAIPESVTDDGIDYYSVTRIADGAFSTLKKDNADPDYVGCEALFSDKELLAEAGIDPLEAEEFLGYEGKASDINGNDRGSSIANALKGCTGILLLEIPASVTTIEEDAFKGFDTLQYLVVSEGDLSYASYDGALYNADLTELRFVPEGRVGVVRVAPSATTVDPEAFAHCPYVDTVVADPESETYKLLEMGVKDKLIDVIAPTDETSSFSMFIQLIDFMRSSGLFGNSVSFSTSVTNDAETRPFGIISEELALEDFALASSQRNTYAAGEVFNMTVNPNGGTLACHEGSRQGESYTTAQTFYNLRNPDTNVANFGHVGLKGASGFQGNWNVSRSGYTFTGWTGLVTLPADMKTNGNRWLYPSTTGTLVANWSPNITVNPNGGTIACHNGPRKGESYSAAVTYNGCSYPATNFSNFGHFSITTWNGYEGDWNLSRTGYTWNGWTGLVTLPLKTTEGDKWANPSTPGTVVANWKANTYTVSFNANGGAGGQTANVTATYNAAMPGISTTPPTREGYTFLGWWDSSATSGGTQYYTAAGASARTWNKASGGTLYARWSANANYTVSFNANGGDGGQTANVTATYDASMPNITSTPPTRTGYDFDGWYDTSASSGGTQYYTAGGASAHKWDKASGATLYARWTPKNYTIKWNAQGGNVVAGVDVTSQAYEKSLKVPDTPTKEGYTFAGWWTTAESDPSEKRVGPGYDVTTVPLSGAEYFARWDKVSGTVTLKAAGGSFTQEQVDAFNDAAGSHPIATLNEDKNEIELPFDVDTKSFSPDLLKPTLKGSTFAGWSPAFAPPSWNVTSLSWNNAVTYTATWSTNVYGVTYQDKGGEPLVGWAAFEGGPSLESVLPQTFNEATLAEGRALPSEPYKLGYTWVEWTYKGVHVSSIPDDAAPDDPSDPKITIVANFTADPYTVNVDLAEGEGEGWPEEYVRDYDDPTVELPADAPKRAGYVFAGLKAYASEEEGAPSVPVIDTAINASVDTLQPGHTYKVLNLADGEGNVYDVKLLRAVWTPRIAVDVTPSVGMGILADFGTNTLKFQCGGTDYMAGDTDDAYAPLEFVSYTTAPVGIVAVTDDTQDAGYATRKAFAEKVFGGAWNTSEVSFMISADPAGANSHSFSLGGSTATAPSGFLDGLTVAKPTGAETSKTTTFYLGMNFGNLTAMDLVTKESGQIAKLYYTVALIGDPESEPSVLAPYDGNGILW